MVPPDPEEPPAPQGADDEATTADDAPADVVADDAPAEGDATTSEDVPAEGDATTSVDGDTPDENSAAGPTESERGKREVELPPSLYKVVTVFSTLLSVLFVVLGFVVLDRATGVVSNPTGSLVVQALALVGVPLQTLVASRSAIALVVGLVGLALVAGGAAVYVYGSRFRAPGMGNPKDEADEPSSDG